jgi:hypothetical protein
MFEKYLEQKEQLLAEQINLSADFINLYELMFNQKIEQAYKTYFSAEADWWIYEEQIARGSNLRFNFEDPKLSSFLLQLDDLYKKNARFSAMSLPVAVSSAVKTRMNYLCRPRTALKWFVYRWDQTKTYHEIIKRLNYFFDYKYLTDGFIEYVRRNNIVKSHDDTISISVFDRIISEIDNQKLAELNPEEFVQMLNPLFAFFNPDADHQDTARIPVEAVIIYFDDKNLIGASTKLEQLFRSGELLLISKKYLLGFIYKSMYDADNLYGGDDDKITKVTKEIEKANSDFLNLTFSLKENIAKNSELSERIDEEYPLNTEYVYEAPSDLDAALNDNEEAPSDFNLNFSLLSPAVKEQGKVEDLCEDDLTSAEDFGMSSDVDAVAGSAECVINSNSYLENSALPDVSVADSLVNESEPSHDENNFEEIVATEDAEIKTATESNESDFNLDILAEFGFSEDGTATNNAPAKNVAPISTASEIGNDSTSSAADISSVELMDEEISAIERIAASIKNKTSINSALTAVLNEFNS